MQIKDLKPKMGNVDVIVDVTDMGDVREFSKFGKPGRVANAVAKDETGTIKLSLWNEQIDAVSSGDKIHIKNGYVNEWQGEMQLTTGRMGTIEVVGKGKEASKSAPKDKEKKETKDIKSKDSKKEGTKAKGEDEEWITPDDKEEDFDDKDDDSMDVDEEEI